MDRGAEGAGGPVDLFDLGRDVLPEGQLTSRSERRVFRRRAQDRGLAFAVPLYGPLGGPAMRVVVKRSADVHMRYAAWVVGHHA